MNQAMSCARDQKRSRSSDTTDSITILVLEADLATRLLAGLEGVPPDRVTALNGVVDNPVAAGLDPEAGSRLVRRELMKSAGRPEVVAVITHDARHASPRALHPTQRVREATRCACARASEITAPGAEEREIPRETS